MIEINTLIYHLNKQATEDNLPYYFTDSVLIQESIKFKIVEQIDDKFVIELDNNLKPTTDMFLNKTFNYGKINLNIINIEISNRITIQIDKQIKLPKRVFSLENKQPILVKSNYTYSREQSGNTFNTFKRIDFGIAFLTDEQGTAFEEIRAYVELFLYRKRKMLQVYDIDKKELIKNKYIFINTNVTTSLFLENRDNIYRTFYVLIKTFNNIN